MFVGNTLVGMLIGVLLIGVVGVLAMTSEYTSGTIRATFAAAPRRLRVLAAKAAVVGAVALIAPARRHAGCQPGADSECSPSTQPSPWSWAR
jgi:predicted anti-sigma-YlaC factor YlaD